MLIETKLHPPVARKEWVERPELIKYLVNAQVKLILVAAPPGFGKTTLVAQWRYSPMNHRPFAWVSLESADNDPVRLWWHVVSSLHLACPGFGSQKILALLGGQPAGFGASVLPVLVSEMAALPEQVVLVLDDYHLIKKPVCHERWRSCSGSSRRLCRSSSPAGPIRRCRWAGCAR